MTTIVSIAFDDKGGNVKTRGKRRNNWSIFEKDSMKIIDYKNKISGVEAVGKAKTI